MSSGVGTARRSRPLSAPSLSAANPLPGSADGSIINESVVFNWEAIGSISTGIGSISLSSEGFPTPEFDPISLSEFIDLMNSDGPDTSWYKVTGSSMNLTVSASGVNWNVSATGAAGCANEWGSYNYGVFLTLSLTGN